MAVNLEEKSPAPQDSDNGTKGTAKVIPLAPDFGRSARVVGQWDSVPASESPHEKNKRGELGKPLFNWYFNRTSRRRPVPDRLSPIFRRPAQHLAASRGPGAS